MRTLLRFNAICSAQPLRALGTMCLFFLATTSENRGFAQSGLLSACSPSEHISGFVLSTSRRPPTDLMAPVAPLTRAAALGPSRVVSIAALPSCERRTWHDKRRHFLLSAAFTGSSYLILKRGAGLSKGPALAISIGAVAALGVAKEVYDKKNGDPPCFSRLDLLANGLGMLTAAGFILIL